MSAVATKQSGAIMKHEPATLAKLEEIAQTCALDTAGTASKFQRAFTLASGIRQLRNLITPDMMSDVVELQDTALGFRTDRDPKIRNYKTGQNNIPYPLGVVKECLIEAVLRGANPIGNEFNIISERCYLTKEFYMRAVGDLPGVTDVRFSPAVPRMMDGGAVVRVSLTWKKDGKADALRDSEGNAWREVAIRINAGMGADAVLGKAARKSFKAAYEQITGSSSGPDGEVGEGDFVEGSVVSAGGTSKLDALKKGATEIPHPTDPDRKIDTSDAQAEPPKAPTAPAGVTPPTGTDVYPNEEQQQSGGESVAFDLGNDEHFQVAMSEAYESATGGTGEDFAPIWKKILLANPVNAGPLSRRKALRDNLVKAMYANRIDADGRIKNG